MPDKTIGERFARDVGVTGTSLAVNTGLYFYVGEGAVAAQAGFATAAAFSGFGILILVVGGVAVLATDNKGSNSIGAAFLDAEELGSSFTNLVLSVYGGIANSADPLAFGKVFGPPLDFLTGVGLAETVVEGALQSLVFLSQAPAWLEDAATYVQGAIDRASFNQAIDDLMAGLDRAATDSISFFGEPGIQQDFRIGVTSPGYGDVGSSAPDAEGARAP